ncbi:MAG: nucleotidyltransferase domain-containing protein [Epsilonproteobacteria bacterium]|nr:nucleotidyltransferase domain-containing protein [Campylobacterota bacterium]
MRLSEKEVEIIKKIIFSEVGECEIYLFGSRVDDSKRGGDVDLMIKKDISTFKRLLIKSKLKEALFKPVDLVVYTNGESLIEKEAIKGIRL